MGIERAGWWRSISWRGWSSWASRYFGRAKTRFQGYLAATVANLILVLGKIGQYRWRCKTP